MVAHTELSLPRWIQDPAIWVIVASQSLRGRKTILWLLWDGDIGRKGLDCVNGGKISDVENSASKEDQ